MSLVGAWGKMNYRNFIVDARESAAGHANNFKVKDGVSFEVNKKNEGLNSLFFDRKH